MSDHGVTVCPRTLFDVNQADAQLCGELKCRVTPRFDCKARTRTWDRGIAENNCATDPEELELAEMISQANDLAVLIKSEFL